MTAMPVPNPAHKVDPVEAARQVLQAHCRTIDGRCRGCFVERGRWVTYPCASVDWAIDVDSCDMTARFLSQ